MLMTKILSFCLVGLCALSLVLIVSTEHYKKENDALESSLALSQQANKDWQDRYKLLEQSFDLNADIIGSYEQEKSVFEDGRSKAINKLKTLSKQEQCDDLIQPKETVIASKVQGNEHVETNDYVRLDGQLPPFVGGLLDQAYDCATSGNCGERDSKTTSR